MIQNAQANGVYGVQIVPESCLEKNRGVPISTPNPIIQKMNLIGGGTNMDTNHIAAAMENPIEYFVVSWRAAGTCLLVRRYSITRTVRITT